MIGCAAPELGAVEIRTETIRPLRQSKCNLPICIGSGVIAGVGRAIERIDLQPGSRQAVCIQNGDQQSIRYRNLRAGATGKAAMIDRAAPELSAVKVCAEAVVAQWQGECRLSAGVRNFGVTDIGCAVEGINCYAFLARAFSVLYCDCDWNGYCNLRVAAIGDVAMVDRPAPELCAI